MKLPLLPVFFLASLPGLAQQSHTLPQKDISGIQCFTGLDTLKASRAKGCYNYFYKVVGKYYVLTVKLDTIPPAGRCMAVNSTPTSRHFTATLSVYSRGNAHLHNICSDVVIGNAPVPSRKLNSTTGQVLINNHGTVSYRGTGPDRMPLFRVSILIHSLAFYDPKTHKKVILKDELFWRVVNDLNEQG